jgi:MYXO-CTERM domain-containing protein
MSRLRAVVAAIALLALAAAPTASAHQGNPHYRSIIDRVTPSVHGLQLQVLNFDDRLELQNGTPWPVVVQGYNGEPYARLLPDGTVRVNKRSPAYYLNNDRTGTEKVPASADPNAAPQWQVVDRAGRFQWHDHRIHWMGTGIPPQVKDQGKRTKVYDWNVPLQVGQQKGRIAGTLWWQPEPGGGVPVPALIGFGALALLGLLAVVVVRRRRAAGAPVEAW